jgi:hypothetical protein
MWSTREVFPSFIIISIYHVLRSPPSRLTNIYTVAFKLYACFRSIAVVLSSISGTNFGSQNGPSVVAWHHCRRPGLEITRIASQFAIEYMSVAMQLRFCVAVGCDAKTVVVLFIYLLLLFTSCHYPIVYRPRPDPACMMD